MKFDHSKLLGRMREKGITQEELAAIVGIKPSTLSFKLNGRSKFTTNEILAICDALGILPDAIPKYFFAIKV